MTLKDCMKVIKAYIIEISQIYNCFILHSQNLVTKKYITKLIIKAVSLEIYNHDIPKISNTAMLLQFNF